MERIIDHDGGDPKIYSGRQELSGNLNTELRACRDPLDVSCTYHKGARHTLHGSRLLKKII
jgi:hypothetical protein